MPEWPNGAVSKTVNRLRGSRVRIPVFPQIEEGSQEIDFLLLDVTGMSDIFGESRFPAI